MSAMQMDPKTEPRIGEADRRPRILVAERDPSVRELLFHYLSGAGFRVEEAENGQTISEKINSEKFDLLIIDYALITFSGAEVLARIYGGGLSMPIIVTSGLGAPRELDGLKEVGVAGVLLKPFSFEKLKRAVEAVLPAVSQLATHADQKALSLDRGVRHWGIND